MCMKIATDMLGCEVQLIAPNRIEGEPDLKNVRGIVRAVTVDDCSELRWYIQEADGFLYCYRDSECVRYYDNDVRQKAFPDSDVVHL